MTFEELIENNPLVNTSRAIPIIAHLTLTQYGILNSEDLNKAYLRISKYITNMMLSSELVTKYFYIRDTRNILADDIEIEYEIPFEPEGR